MDEQEQQQQDSPSTYVSGPKQDVRHIASSETHKIYHVNML